MNTLTVTDKRQEEAKELIDNYEYAYDVLTQEAAKANCLSFFELVWGARKDLAAARMIFQTQTLETAFSLYGTSYGKMVLALYKQLYALAKGQKSLPALQSLFMKDLRAKEKMIRLDDLCGKIRSVLADRLKQVPSNAEESIVVATVIAGSWGRDSARPDSDLDLLPIWNRDGRAHPAFFDINDAVEEACGLPVDRYFQAYFSDRMHMKDNELRKDLSFHSPYSVVAVQPQIEKKIRAMQNKRSKKASSLMPMSMRGPRATSA